MIYVLVDGKYHQQPGADPRTTCGVEIPYGAEWTRETPDKVCGDCEPKKGKKAA
jgi:hypothetical protein